MLIGHPALTRMGCSAVIFEAVHVLERLGALMAEPWPGGTVGGGEMVGLLRFRCEVLGAQDAREGVLVDRHVALEYLTDKLVGILVKPGVARFVGGDVLLSWW